jgi:hypothetical protein
VSAGTNRTSTCQRIKWQPENVVHLSIRPSRRPANGASSTFRVAAAVDIGYLSRAVGGVTGHMLVLEVVWTNFCAGQFRSSLSV